MILCEDVVKKFPHNPVPSLDQVNFTVEAGEFAYLMGPSGSGKSTIISLLLQEIEKTSGNILVLGQKVSHLKGGKLAAYRRKIGVIFQDYRLLEQRTVAENVAYVLQVLNTHHKKIPALVKEALTKVNLLDKAKNFPPELSGGEQQRVAIARAMVIKPLLILADEPTGNLDMENSVAILQLLEELNRKGTTVLMATHDENLTKKYPHRTLLLQQGKIVQDLPVPPALEAIPQEPLTQRHPVISQADEKQLTDEKPVEKEVEKEKEQKL